MRRSVFGNDVAANVVHDYADQVDISFWNKWDFDLESGSWEKRVSLQICAKAVWKRAVDILIPSAASHMLYISSRFHP